jgi:hypothetical protein
MARRNTAAAERPRTRRWRPSKIDRLPAEVRDFIARARANGRTAEEIRDDCRKAFPSIAGPAWPMRSRFARYIRRLDQLAEKTDRLRVAAETLIGRIGSRSSANHAPELRGEDAPPSHYRCDFVLKGDANIRSVLLTPIESDGAERPAVRCEFPEEIIRRLCVGRLYRLTLAEIEPPAVIEAEGDAGPASWRPGKVAAP